MINKNKLSAIIDIDKHPINSSIYRTECKRKLDNEGVLVLTDFLLKDTIKKILKEANKQENLAYYCVNKHNVYLEPSDPSFQDSHPRNKTVISSKGCITDNQVPSDSYLRFLYNSKRFKEFLKSRMYSNLPPDMGFCINNVIAKEELSKCQPSSCPSLA